MLALLEMTGPEGYREIAFRLVELPVDASDSGPFDRRSSACAALGQEFAAPANCRLWPCALEKGGVLMQFHGWFNSWPGTFRHWSYPPALRIDMRAYGDQEAMELEVPQKDPVVEESLLPAAAPPSVAPAAQAPVDDLDTQKFLAQLCTALWRARSKMVDASGQPTPEVRRAYRHVQASWDLLREYGLEVMDHTDQPYDSGQALKVISLEKRTDIAQARVLETVVPTVYLRGRSIQMGEVIVLVPDDATGRNTPVK